MKYGSVCSGIEAATVAWHSLGWQPQWFSEIEAFPSAVLAHHYPQVPNQGDMTKYKEWGLTDGSIDLLVGGTPCQSFSVAGLREGLRDPRGSLMLTYLAIAASARPRWLVWENVPGVLSSHGGRDFGAFLGALAELGYGWAYRVLNAQHFGIPQRRRRVFVVGHLGGWRRAAAVLFEQQSLLRNPAPGSKAREDVAGTLDASLGRRRGIGMNPNQLMPARRHCRHGHQQMEQGNGRPAGDEHYNLIAPTLLAQGNRAGGSRPPGTTVDTCASLIAFSAKDYGADAGEIAPTLRAGGHANSHANAGVMPAIQQGAAVRRLTPRECERLQGFPDDYTQVTYRKKPAADGPRYKAVGNSMAVPVMNWIGRRIQMVEGIK